MRHCMDFSPSDVWFLLPNEEFFKRKIYVGFCPVCGKPVAELKQFSKEGKCLFKSISGFDADKLCRELKPEVDFKYSSLVLAKTRSKTYGWLYGVNKLNEVTGKVEQFAKDFYGNSELVKTYQK